MLSGISRGRVESLRWSLGGGVCSGSCLRRRAMARAPRMRYYTPRCVLCVGLMFLCAPSPLVEPSLISIDRSIKHRCKLPCRRHRRLGQELLVNHSRHATLRTAYDLPTRLDLSQMASPQLRASSPVLSRTAHYPVQFLSPGTVPSQMASPDLQQDLQVPPLHKDLTCPKDLPTSDKDLHSAV